MEVLFFSGTLSKFCFGAVEMRIRLILFSHLNNSTILDRILFINVLFTNVVSLFCWSLPEVSNNKSSNLQKYY